MAYPASGITPAAVYAVHLCPIPTKDRVAALLARFPLHMNYVTPMLSVAEKLPPTRYSPWEAHASIRYLKRAYPLPMRHTTRLLIAWVCLAAANATTVVPFSLSINIRLTTHFRLSVGQGMIPRPWKQPEIKTHSRYLCLVFSGPMRANGTRKVVDAAVVAQNGMPVS
jgi:hypothetical protein